MLFSFPEYTYFSEVLSDLPRLRLGQFSVKPYENKELHVSVQSPVSGEDCFILGSIAAPERQMASMPLLAHTLNRL